MAITRTRYTPPVIEEYHFEGADARELSELLGKNLTIPDALRMNGESGLAERYLKFSRKFFGVPVTEPKA